MNNKRLSSKQLRLLNRQLPKVKERIPSINHGGCGIFALMLYNKLVKSGFKAQIFCVVDDEYEASNLSSGHQSVNHVVVRVGRRFFDATGQTQPIEWGRKVGSIEAKILEGMLERSYLWNNYFFRERKIHIPKIKEVLNSFEL